MVSVAEEVDGSSGSSAAIDCSPVAVTELRGNNLIRTATVTASVFAPRTEDMNSGFLMPNESGNSGLTIVDDVTATDPAQDLTHLAPEAGDTYIPLDLDNLPSFDGLDMDDLLHDIDLMNASASQSSPSDCQGSSLDDVCALDDSSPHATNSLFNSLDFPRHKFEDGITGDSDSGISSISASPSDHRQDSIDKLPTGDISTLGTTTTDRVSPLNNDPFLSFTGNPCLDTGRSSPATLRTALPSLDPFHGSPATLYDPPDHCRGLPLSDDKESSVWDSPPSSSSSSFGTSDLDLCADLNDDARREENSARAGAGNEDFPLLNDDESIWESFVRSSLTDIMSPDGLLSENRAESTSTISYMKPPPPPLPLTSNLAMLLQQTLPLVKPQPAKKISTKPLVAGSSVSKLFSDHAFTKSSGSLPNIVVQNGLRSVRLTAPAITLTDGQFCGNHFILSGGKLTTSSGEGLPANSHIIINYDDLTKKSKGITSIKTLQIQGKVISGQNHSVIIAQNLKRSVNEPPSPAVKKFRDSTTGLFSSSVCSMFFIISLFTISEPTPVKGNSVLMNLLVNGEDVNNGYSRSNNAFNLGKCYSGPR